jgi:hypothetical protein
MVRAKWQDSVTQETQASLSSVVAKSIFSWKYGTKVKVFTRVLDVALITFIAKANTMNTIKIARLTPDNKFIWNI